jgi:hypothetical protein
MADKTIDPIKPWFDAMEELGEYIGIRFGRVPTGTTQPEWIFLRHTDFDGIGGFADILRRRGAEISRLPQIKYPSEPSWSWFVKTIPKYLKPRHRLKWGPLKQGKPVNPSVEPPPAVAWHVFDEAETMQIKRAGRNGGFTVNSFLLKHLSKALRPFLQDEASVMPWMIPVNLRGKVVRERDTCNFSSYVTVNVRSYETVKDVHRNIYRSLAGGEHWANWYAYTAGRPLSAGIKKYLLVSDKAMSQWNLGGFSNLGDWDAEKRITVPDCAGDWLFSPPVLRCQLVGAGCVTFQNRLTITMQAHPDLTTHPEVAETWMQNWVKEIEMDLSLLAQATTAAQSGVVGTANPFNQLAA